WWPILARPSRTLPPAPARCSVGSAIRSNRAFRMPATRWGSRHRRSKSRSQRRRAAPSPPSFTGDPFGYNQARREWAKKLEIDPYTTNPVLRPLLDNAASAMFAGNFAISLTVGAVAAPLQYASEFETTVRDSVWNQPPVDLAKSNEEKLLRIGVARDAVRAFLRNK